MLYVIIKRKSRCCLKLLEIKNCVDLGYAANECPSLLERHAVGLMLLVCLSFNSSYSRCRQIKLGKQLANVWNSSFRMPKWHHYLAMQSHGKQDAWMVLPRSSSSLASFVYIVYKCVKSLCALMNIGEWTAAGTFDCCCQMSWVSEPPLSELILMQTRRKAKLHDL